MAELNKREVFRNKVREVLLAKGGKIDGQLSDFLRSVRKSLAEDMKIDMQRTESFRALQQMYESGEVVVHFRKVGKRKVSESIELCKVDAGTKTELPPTEKKVVEKKLDPGFEQLRQFIAMANPKVQEAFGRLLQVVKKNDADWRARAMMAESKLQEIKCVLDEGQAEPEKSAPEKKPEPVAAAPKRAVKPATVVRVVEKAPKADQRSKEVIYKELVALRLRVQYDLLIAESKGAHALEKALERGRDELGIPADKDWRKNMAPYLGRTRHGHRGDFILRYTRNSPDEVLASKLVELADAYTKIDGKSVTVQMLVLEREAALKKEQERIARMQKGKADSRAKNTK